MLPPISLLILPVGLPICSELMVDSLVRVAPAPPTTEPPVGVLMLILAVRVTTALPLPERPAARIK